MGAELPSVGGGQDAGSPVGGPIGGSPRVLIVDADRRVQQSVADALELSGRVLVVGATADPREALELIAESRPEVVVMDPRLPELPAALPLLGAIRGAWPRLRVILIGWADALENAELARNADAVVDKNASPDDFVSAVLDACCSAPMTSGSALKLHRGPNAAEVGGD